MEMSVRVVLEFYNSNSGEVTESKVIRDDKIKRPVKINELGYLHREQIEILESVQNFKIKHESVLINQEISNCPLCGKKPKSSGIHQSNFHAALTDHRVNIQRKSCQCGWSSPYTVSGLFGNSSHPDLIEKQITQGAETSYRQASRNLNAESKKERSINNDDRLRRNVALVASSIEKNKLKDVKPAKKEHAVKKLIAVIDGGHLKSNQKGSRSFEAMIATIFCPDNIQHIDKHHNEITKKTSVASALSDKQETIKQLTINACRTEGANAQITELTCLTDGANNCWSIANSLKSCCKKLVTILDWFHITKKFTIIFNCIDADFKDKLERVKWFLWHGKANDALVRLQELQKESNDKKLLDKLQELYEYLERNKTYMTNYQKRKTGHLPYTSTYAESSVNAVINARQKNDKKMQWSREGAHNILQIRTSKFSKTWDEDWNNAQNEIYRQAA